MRILVLWEFQVITVVSSKKYLLQLWVVVHLSSCSLMYCSIGSYLIILFICLFVCLFICSFIHCWFVHSFIRSFICLFIHSFKLVHSVIRSLILFLIRFNFSFNQFIMKRREASMCIMIFYLRHSLLLLSGWTMTLKIPASQVFKHCA